MAGDLLALMWVPFLMCLVLTGIHAYLGFHVIAREVVFVDIALAQIAALGATAAFLLGFDSSPAVLHARAGLHGPRRPRPRADTQPRAPGLAGGDHRRRVRRLLRGRRAPRRPRPPRRRAPPRHARRQHPERERREAAKVAVLYAAVGLFHWRCRRAFLLISIDPAARIARAGACGGGTSCSTRPSARRDQLGADRRRAPRLLVSHRAGARRVPAGGCI